MQNFDPLKSVSGADYSYYYLVYDTLIDMDKESNPIPNLVKSWDIPDNQTIVLNLREDVKFHDGTPFDAEVVKFNLERANSEVSNTKDLSSIESITVLDPFTVELNLSQPDASILLVLTDRPGVMISPTAFEEHGEDYHLHPVGTGPFKVTKHLTNEEVVYEANDDYWKEDLPSLDSITIKVMTDGNTVINALKTGEIQASNIDASSINVFKDDPDFNVSISPQLVYHALYLNTNIKPLDNHKVREGG